MDVVNETDGLGTAETGGGPSAVVGGGGGGDFFRTFKESTYLMNIDGLCDLAVYDGSLLIHDEVDAVGSSTGLLDSC